MDEFAGHTGINWNGHVGTVQYGGGDQRMVVMFYNRAIQNQARSAEEGRPFYEDKIYVRIHPPGERLNIVDREVVASDKNRWPIQWAQYKANAEQVPEGTPIDLLFASQPSVAAMLKAHGVHTVEQCAELSASAIENIGMGAQAHCNNAQKYLATATKGVKYTQMKAELDERDRTITGLKHEMDLLRQEVQRLQQAGSPEISMSQLQQALAGLQGRPTMPVAGRGVGHAFDSQSAQIAATHVTADIAKGKQQAKKVVAGKRPRSRLSA